MELEVGKFYKTRNGRKAYVAGIVPHSTDYGYIGKVYGHVDEANTWDKMGNNHPLTIRDIDLVDEWREKAVGVFFANIYGPYCGPSTFKSREDADASAAPGRIACIEVPWAEGQGLEREAGK